MKSHTIRNFLFLFLLLVLNIVIYAFHIKYIYLNAEGQKKAICLARSLVKLYNKEGHIPDEFIKEVSFLFSDKRNVIFQLRIKNQSEFEIEYRPKPTWIFQLSEYNSQVLRIFWNKEMNDIKIESSIKLP
jgi:hypothetical protein